MELKDLNKTWELLQQCMDIIEKEVIEQMKIWGAHELISIGMSKAMMVIQQFSYEIKVAPLDAKLRELRDDLATNKKAMDDLRKKK